ncbi:MAG: glycine--tRNA ligase subunit beta [Proteobacteria bacterium]|nr:glycine--tRNA ligase subunit beta [Pseudomonadota bacterium]
MKTRDLILEIGTEEIPAGYLPPALEALARMAREEFKKARIGSGELQALGTPRRIVLFGRKVEELQAPLVTEKLGPAWASAFDAQGTPTKTAQGFARSQGLEVKDLAVRETEKGKYLAAVKKEEGKPAAPLIAEMLSRLILEIPFPKTMRWAEEKIGFVRPIHWILALFGDEILEIKVGQIKAGRKTRGHRFLSPGERDVQNLDEYLSWLPKAFVILDPEDRIQLVERELERLAKEVGGLPFSRPKLLREVANLVEYPQGVLGRLADEVGRLPREVVIAALENHERCFAVEGADGALLPRFVAVMNNVPRDPGPAIRGYERVMRARLNDAIFFYKKDLEISLADRVQRLKGVVFHSRLGTAYEKVERFTRLALFLTRKLWPEEEVRVQRAAFLAKADLASEMVGEFPELQGVMGSEYARKQGEDPEVARAILEHYLPRQAEDRLPESRTGILVGLADRADTIAGFLAVGIKPSGEADPFGTRRHTLAILNILLGREIFLSLSELFGEALKNLSGVARFSETEVKTEILNYFQTRLRGIFLASGAVYDSVDAVLTAGSDDPCDAKLRLAALSQFRARPEFEKLAIACKRAANILGDFQKTAVNHALLTEPEEKELSKIIERLEIEVDYFFKQRDYTGVLSQLLVLKDPVDSFFDKVMVMCEERELRENRLALLFRISRIFRRVADFSKLVIK